MSQQLGSERKQYGKNKEELSRESQSKIGKYDEDEEELAMIVKTILYSNFSSKQ